MSDSVALRVEALSKHFGREHVVTDISFSQKTGEYFCFLGASGSGKTTLLRLIAGLETPGSGRVFLFGKDVTHLEPHKRNVPMVFQHLSLWPHMTVLEQITFCLNERGFDRHAIRRIASAAIERVGLVGLENRRPGELSGGQQQRAALARALALDEQIILLDEPLANLDACLKSEMRALFKRLQTEFGVTVLHVTHDREDAFELADRVAVIDKGRIIALETPEALYRHPDTVFTASLLGEVNRLPGRIVADEPDGVVVETDLGLWRACGHAEGFRPGNRVALLFRPEKIEENKAVNEALSSYNYFSGIPTSCRAAGPFVVIKLLASANAGGYVVTFTQYGVDGTTMDISRRASAAYRVPVSAVIAIRDE